MHTMRRIGQVRRKGELISLHDVRTRCAAGSVRHEVVGRRNRHRSISRYESRSGVRGLVPQLLASYSGNDYSHPLPLLPHIAIVTETSACEQSRPSRTVPFMYGARQRPSHLICGLCPSITDTTFVLRFPRGEWVQHSISRDPLGTNYWCRGRDSNPHALLGQRILSPPRLPFRHPGTE